MQQLEYTVFRDESESTGDFSIQATTLRNQRLTSPTQIWFECKKYYIVTFQISKPHEILII